MLLANDSFLLRIVGNLRSAYLFFMLASSFINFWKMKSFIYPLARNHGPCWLRLFNGLKIVFSFLTACSMVYLSLSLWPEQELIQQCETLGQNSSFHFTEKPHNEMFSLFSLIKQQMANSKYLWSLAFHSFFGHSLLSILNR